MHPPYPVNRGVVVGEHWVQVEPAQFRIQRPRDHRIAFVAVVVGAVVGRWRRTTRRRMRRVGGRGGGGGRGGRGGSGGVRQEGLGIAEGGDLLVFSQGIAYPHSRGVTVEGGVVVVIVIVVIVCRRWVHHCTRYGK